MKKIIPKDKLSPKLKKKLSLRERKLWPVQPVTRVKESRKQYQRRQKHPARYKEGGKDAILPKMQDTL